ncbi:MAG: AI-2E family transporter, partial [Planctomycetota bacterium]
AGAEDTESSPTLPLGASQDETVVDEETAIATIIPNVTVDTNALMAVVEEIVPKINEFLKRFQLPLLVTETVVQYVGDFVERVAAPLALDGVKILFSTLFSLAIMVLTLYYFFADGPNMVVALMKLSPLDDTYEQELLDKFADVSRSVVVAVLLSAIAQGLLAGIGYFFAGVQNVFLCTVLTCFLAMVPFVGATIIWIPICLVLAYVGHPTAAIVLAVYCATVVSMVDNLIKPLVLHGQANLHPLLALLSVIGGIQALGPIGILVGPMLVAFLQALLNMLNKELELLGKESDETGTPVVFATDSAGETAATPAALPTPKQAKKQKRRRKK